MERERQLKFSRVVFDALMIVTNKNHCYLHRVVNQLYVLATLNPEKAHHENQSLDCHRLFGHKLVNKIKQYLTKNSQRA